MKLNKSSSVCYSSLHYYVSVYTFRHLYCSDPIQFCLLLSFVYMLVKTKILSEKNTCKKVGSGTNVRNFLFNLIKCGC